ncbi:MAG: hypothetical protein DMG06_03390 [Acidobacteria bacterium]|nr:MAG: hypothetical protein DMG06_03390 [Acidobacteriota bacterium]
MIVKREQVVGSFSETPLEFGHLSLPRSCIRGPAPNPYPVAKRRIRSQTTEVGEIQAPLTPRGGSQVGHPGQGTSYFLAI